jgi:hypothetical protein
LLDDAIYKKNSEKIEGKFSYLPPISEMSIFDGRGELIGLELALGFLSM